MNIDNLNPVNNNQNNLNSGINPPEPNIAPAEPNFGTPPISPEPTPGVPPVSPSPMPGPAPVPPVNPEPVPGPAPVPPVSPSPMPGPALVPPVNPEPAPGPGPVQPVSPQTMSSINLAPEGVASNTPVVDPPSPLMGSTLTANTPLTNEQQMNNTPVNAQNINPANNMISENPATFGGVPTPQAPVMDNMIPNKPPKKKGAKKSIIIILIFILILGIGAGVYYFLNVANVSAPISSISIVPTLTEWELGEKLSKNASDYATISGVDASSCTVNTDAVNVNEPNSYTYTITCPGTDAKSSDLRVRDTKGPEVVLKELTVKPGSEIEINDFISKCEDPSISNECDITIKDDTIDLNELVTNVGTYTIPLSVKDDFNNETEIEATLIVDENAPSQFLSCELAEPLETTTNAVVSENYEYGLNDNNEIVTVKRKISYKFKKQEDYEQAKNDYNSNSTIDELTGKASFDDKKYIINLDIDVSASDIKSSLKADTDLKTYEDITLYHENAGDFCSLP